MAVPLAHSRPHRARLIITALVIAILGAALCAYLVVIWFDWAPWLRGWKKYPDGWSWRFLETVPRLDRFATAALGLGFIAAGLAWLVWRLDRATRWRIAGGITLLVIGAYALQMGTLGLKLSSGHALLVNRILDEDFTGYYKAAETVVSPAEFFTDWRRLMKACGHCTSHPTGATAFYWPSIQWASSLPPDEAASIASWLQETFRLRVRNTAPEDVIGAFVVGHLNLLLAALSVLPYAALGQVISGRRIGGVMAAGLVATLPGLILMSPELDQVYVLISGGALLACLIGLRHASWWWSVALGAVCGLLMALGLFLTWGLLVWLPLMGCIIGAYLLGFQAFHHAHRIPFSQRLVRAVLVVVGAVTALALPYLILAALTPYDVRDVARQGLAHYQTFEAIGRPGGAIWLFHGPLDTTQFIGLPLTLGMLLATLGSSGVALTPGPARLRAALGRINVYSVGLVGIIAVTFLGSYMKAESGRQLLFIMPLAALAVSATLHGSQGRASLWHWLLLLAQALITVIIGARWITP